MQSYYEFTIRQGNTLPTIIYQVPSAAISSLAGGIVKWYYWLTDGSGSTSPRDAALVGDGSTNQVQYQWTIGDTDVAGDYYGRFEITMPDGKILSTPNGRNIRFTIFPR